MDKIYCVRATNLTTGSIQVGLARYTLQDVLQMVETANQTADAWFYEIAIASDQKSDEIRNYRASRSG
jgi:carbon starvation protein CstA